MDFQSKSSDFKGFCVTCLSPNRNVISVNNAQKIAIMEFLLEYKLQIPLNLCWECGAQLDNICKFQLKAKNSMNVMYDYLGKNLELPNNEVKCFSKLNQTNITNTSIDGEMHSVKIKLEPIHDDEVPIKIEPIFYDEFHQPATSTPSDQEKRTAFATKRYNASNINVAAKYKPKKKRMPQHKGQPIDNLDLNVDNSDLESNSSLLEVKETNDPVSDVVVDITSGDEFEPLTQKPFKKNSEHGDKFRKIKISREDLQRKRTERSMNPSYISKTYKCDTCVLGFATEEHFAFHYDSCHHESRGRFVCAICSRRYQNKKCARVHALRHFHAFQCVLCDQQYECWSKDSFVRHYNEKHGLKGSTCKICRAPFQTIEELRSHMRAVHYQFKCDCGISYFSQYNLDRHLMKGCKKRKGREEDKEMYHCAECNKSYENKYYYRAHFTTAKHVSKDAPMFTCDACGKQCSNKKSLAQHIILKHTTEKNYRCGVCEERFLTAKELQFHEKLSHGEVNDRVCNICGVEFPVAKMMVRHMAIHSKERPHKCGECAETFGSQADLTRHNKIKHKKNNLDVTKENKQKRKRKDVPIEIKEVPIEIKKEAREINEETPEINEETPEINEETIEIKKETIEICIDV